MIGWRWSKFAANPIEFQVEILTKIISFVSKFVTKIAWIKQTDLSIVTLEFMISVELIYFLLISKRAINKHRMKLVAVWSQYTAGKRWILYREVSFSLCSSPHSLNY